MQKIIYRSFVIIWAISFLTYLSYLGYHFYEIEIETALVESLGQERALEDDVSYNLQTAASVFELEGEIKESLQTYAASYFLVIPTALRDAFFNDGWQIILTKKDIADSYYDGSVKGRLAAVTNYKQKKIYIHASRSDIRRALLHEFGHYTDYRFGGISQSDSFYQIYQTEKNLLNEKWKIDSHATSNPQEYFAESFSLYLIYPSESKNQTPRTHKIMQELYMTSR